MTRVNQQSILHVFHADFQGPCVEFGPFESVWDVHHPDVFERQLPWDHKTKNTLKSHSKGPLPLDISRLSPKRWSCSLFHGPSVEVAVSRSTALWVFKGGCSWISTRASTVLQHTYLIMHSSLEYVPLENWLSNTQWWLQCTQGAPLATSKPVASAATQRPCHRVTEIRAELHHSAK